MKLYLFGLLILVVGLALLALPALSLPVMAQPEEPSPCGCAEPPPGGTEPRAPTTYWLPLVSAQVGYAELGPPPLMPEKPGTLDKPVRPPTSAGPVYLPMVAGVP